MKLVYTHENKLLVENAKNILQQHNIDCVLKNEYASGGIGDLSPIDAWPEVWVLHDHEADHAHDVLANLRQDSTLAPWTCSRCGESNEPSFEICWACQGEQ